MKFMLIMNGTKADFDWYSSWSQEEHLAQFAFMHAFNQELQQSGKLVAAEGLGFPNEARVITAGNDGSPVINAAFPESKEFLAGFWIVEVDNADEAYRLAAQVSDAPGNKSRGNQPIEVRQVMSGPPDVK